MKRTSSLGGNQLIEDIECSEKALKKKNQEQIITYPEVSSASFLIIHCSEIIFLIKELGRAY